LSPPPVFADRNEATDDWPIASVSAEFQNEIRGKYPKDGPRNGLKMYKAVGVALLSALLTSAIVPAPIERAGEKASPAKKRRIHSVQMFWEQPAPTVKSIPIGMENVYTMCLPYCSERGAAITGPNPRAST
jgi:hypothetical protein